MYQRTAGADGGHYIPAGAPTERTPHTPMEQGFPMAEKRCQPQSDNQKAPLNPRELLSRLKLSSMDAGDLLLAAILYFTLHDTGDDELFWIAAILFLSGK